MVHLICVNCSQPNAPEAKFCGECGAGLLRRFCTSCRAVNNAEALYCQSCGTQLPLPLPVDALVASDDAVQTAEPMAIAQTGRPPTRARRWGGRGQRGADAQVRAEEGPARLHAEAERLVEQTAREAAATPAVETMSTEWPQVRAGAQVIETPTRALPTATPASLSIDPPQRRIGKGATLAAAGLLAVMAGAGVWLMSARQGAPVGTQTSAQPSNAAIAGVALPAAATVDVPKPQSAAVAVADKPISPGAAGADKAAERRADDRPATAPEPRPVAATSRRSSAAAVPATARPRETSTECTPTTDALGLCTLKINSEGR